MPTYLGGRWWQLHPVPTYFRLSCIPCLHILFSESFPGRSVASRAYIFQAELHPVPTYLKSQLHPVPTYLNSQLHPVPTTFDVLATLQEILCECRRPACWPFSFRW